MQHKTNRRPLLQLALKGAAEGLSDPWQDCGCHLRCSAWAWGSISFSCFHCHASVDVWCCRGVKRAPPRAFTSKGPSVASVLLLHKTGCSCAAVNQSKCSRVIARCLANIFYNVCPLNPFAQAHGVSGPMGLCLVWTASASLCMDRPGQIHLTQAPQIIGIFWKNRRKL